MKFDLLSPYANEFAKWIGFRSAKSILENQDIVRLQRPRLDPEFIKLFKENDLLRKAAKNAVQDVILGKPAIPASLQTASDVAQAIKKIKKITLTLPTTLPTPKLPSFYLIESSSGAVVVPPSLPGSPAIRPPMPPLPSLPGSPAIRPPMPPLPSLPGSPAVPPSMPPLPHLPVSPAVPPSMPPLPPIPVGPAVPPPIPPLPPIQPLFPIGPAIRPPMNPLPLIQPNFPKSVIQPPPPLPIGPAVPPPMSPLPPIQPPFSSPVVHPPLITPPPIHVNPPVVGTVTPPPMSPFPSIQPHFPNPVVQPHAIPSPTIHVNPHLPGSGSMPTSDPVPDFDSIPGGGPPGGTPPGGFGSKWVSLLPLIGKLALPILSLIPPLLYAFYNSEERILQNINVNILATRTPKKYTVAFGNKDGEEMGIDFEVVAGKFYRDEFIEANYGFAHAIFKAKTLLSYLPIIRRFEWKRQIHETDCNITIDDPGNLSLQEGPISVYYPLSENEGFNIIYRDPTATSAIATSLFNGRTHDYHLNAEDSEYSSFNTASMKVVEPLGRYEKERTQTASLPFDDDPKKADHYYLKVTQYNAAVE